MPDFTEQIRDDLRALIYDIVRRIEAWLEPFADDLQEFLSTLLKVRLSADWRERWHAFVDESAVKGFVVQPQSVVELETWIEAWARRRRLLPEPLPAELPQLPMANGKPDPPGESEPDNGSDDVPRDEPIDQELDADFVWQNFQRPGPAKKTQGSEQLFNDKLAEAHRCLDEIKRVLDALGDKLDAAKPNEEIEVETVADAVEALIFRYNDVLESARDSWLRDHLSGEANTRLLAMRTPATFGLPLFIDDAQAERARRQGLLISRHLGQRNVTMDRIVLGAQIVEGIGTAAGIAIGGGVILKAAKTGGKWAVVKVLATAAAGMVAEQAVERGLRAVGANEETIRGFRLAVAVVVFVIYRRKGAPSGAEPPAPAGKPAPPASTPPQQPAGKLSAPTSPSAERGRPAPKGPLKNPSGNLDDAARAARTQPHGPNPARPRAKTSGTKPPAGLSEAARIKATRPSGLQTGPRPSNYLSGRYSEPASNPGAYWASERRVFPTRRNSGLSGPALRSEQKSFFIRGLLQGKMPGELRGQAMVAGYERGSVITSDRLADRGAEKALQEALRAVGSSQ